jgi:CRISPR-associated endonuclease/helicase Cas3
MHQLANAVIVFDEVQTVPIKLTHLFTTALRFLVHVCGATTVLCTATQPPLEDTGNQHRGLTIPPENHIVQNEQKLFEGLRRVEVMDQRKPGGWTWSEIADLAERALREKGSVLAVMNTRASAQALYREVKARISAYVYHLSTNMCPAHRLNVLRRVRARLKYKRPVICVSTQLIEAGVDIDFGAVIRALAGLDSVGQSAGRCNRHGLRDEPGSVWVINPQEEDLGRLPDIKVGREKAQTVLDEFKEDPARFGGDPIGLQAMADFYRYYFTVRERELDYLVGNDSPVGRDDDLYNLLSTNTLALDEHGRTNLGEAPPDMLLRQSFKAAANSFRVIDTATQGVVVHYQGGQNIIADLCSAPDLEIQYKLLRRAQRYSVNLFKHQFDELSKIGAIQEVQPGVGLYYLDEQYYSQEFGWSDEPVKGLTVQIV